MRVLQISHGIYPLRQAGTEIYTASLASALVREGVKVTVIIPVARPNDPMERIPSLPSYVNPTALAPGRWWGNKVRYATGRGPLWKAEIRALLRGGIPDVIHLHHAIGFGIDLLEVLAECGIPIVVTLPDYWLLCPGILRRCGGDRSRCARECCSQVGIPKYLAGGSLAYLAAHRRRVRRFVSIARPWLAAISDSTRCAFEMEGFGSDRLLTHPWGIDVASIRQAAAGERFSASAVPRIGYLGTMRHHKGCHVLTESFKRLQVPSTLHFHGSGDNEYVDSLRADCAAHDVHFHGRFDHADVARILSKLDIVVVPSLWEETYCLVAQEAMAAGKPVIATEVGGLADRISHGVNGFLVPPGDVPALARQLTEILSRWPDSVQSLDYERCLFDINDDARAWIELYQRAIREAGTPQRGSRTDHAAQPVLI
jgi:glycosyltransferase involved in cell wall biosynthesis